MGKILSSLNGNDFCQVTAEQEPISSQLESAAAEFSAKLQKQRPSTPAAHLDTSFNSLTEGETYHVPPCDEQSLEDYPLDTSNINVAVANSSGHLVSSGHGAAQEPSLPDDAELLKKLRRKAVKSLVKRKSIETKLRNKALKSLMKKRKIELGLGEYSTESSSSTSDSRDCDNSKRQDTTFVVTLGGLVKSNYGRVLRETPEGSLSPRRSDSKKKTNQLDLSSEAGEEELRKLSEQEVFVEEGKLMLENKGGQWMVSCCNMECDTPEALRSPARLCEKDEETLVKSPTLKGILKRGDTDVKQHMGAKKIRFDLSNERPLTSIVTADRMIRSHLSIQGHKKNSVDRLPKHSLMDSHCHIDFILDRRLPKLNLCTWSRLVQRYPALHHPALKGFI